MLCVCRQIEAEHEKETAELQQCWMELRHVVRCVYREAGTGLSSPHDSPQHRPQQALDTDIANLPDLTKMKELVNRCAIDTHIVLMYLVNRWAIHTHIVLMYLVNRWAIHTHIVLTNLASKYTLVRQPEESQI